VSLAGDITELYCEGNFDTSYTWMFGPAAQKNGGNEYIYPCNDGSVGDLPPNIKADLSKVSKLEWKVNDVVVNPKLVRQYTDAYDWSSYCAITP
jgi:hypothetical protein